mgnify:CR=1 FL=1
MKFYYFSLKNSTTKIKIIKIAEIEKISEIRHWIPSRHSPTGEGGFAGVTKPAYFSFYNNLT